MKYQIIVALILLFSSCLNAQEADKIIAKWLTANGESKIQITKSSTGKYTGQIIWLKTPNRDGKPKIDDKNPDVKLRTRPVLGLNLLNGFVYDEGDKEWNDGTIYDPKEGKTYKCLMWFDKDPNVLHVKGYIGFSLIGKETLWTKVNE